MSMILEYDYFGTSRSWDLFSDSITGFKGEFQFGFHANSHNFVGGGEALQQKIITTLYAPADPVFYLIHSWVDYVWSLWLTCHGFDEVPLTDLKYRKDIYAEEKEESYYPDCNLDSPLIFEGIKDKTWSYYKEMQPTILTAHDFNVWDVTYQRGTFFDR
eukprot:180698_1